MERQLTRDLGLTRRQVALHYTCPPSIAQSQRPAGDTSVLIPHFESKQMCNKNDHRLRATMEKKTAEIR